MSKIMELGGTASAGMVSGGGVRAELFGYYDVDREGHGDVSLFPLGHDARYEVEAVFFVDGAAYFLALCLEEGGAHTSAHQKYVQFFHEPFNDGDFIADLGAAEEDGEGSGGVFRGHAEIFQFPVKQETGYRREIVSHALGGGVSPVGCAEGIVDENIGESSEGGSEFGVVGFLTGVEAEVFEEEDVTGGKGLGLESDSITDYSVCHLDRSADEVGKASGDGGQPELVVHLALGPTHVRAKHEARAPVQEELEGGEGGPDAAIVEDCAGLGVQGDVEVDPDKDSLAVYVDLVDCFLGHAGGLVGYGKAAHLFDSRVGNYALSQDGRSFARYVYDGGGLGAGARAPVDYQVDLAVELIGDFLGGDGIWASGNVGAGAGYRGG